MNLPKFGDKSEQVKAIQQQLLNFYGKSVLPRYGADGGFGQETVEALKRFQSEHGIPVTGTVDVDTWSRLSPASTTATNPAQASNAGKELFTSARALDKYGKPGLAATQGKYMETWIVPQDIRAALFHVKFAALGTIGFPEKIFINKDFRPQLEAALRNVINRGLAHELKVWDGCYQLRNKVSNANSYSMHAWGLAVDINAAENGYNRPVKLSNAFLKCFTDCHIISGAFWSIKDGMHFELAR